MNRLSIDRDTREFEGLVDVLLYVVGHMDPAEAEQLREDVYIDSMEELLNKGIGLIRAATPEQKRGYADDVEAIISNLNIPTSERLLSAAAKKARQYAFILDSLGIGERDLHYNEAWYNNQATVLRRAGKSRFER